jgi:hypothetical protein
LDKLQLGEPPDLKIWPQDNLLARAEGEQRPSYKSSDFGFWSKRRRMGKTFVLGSTKETHKIKSVLFY